MDHLDREVLRAQADVEIARSKVLIARTDLMLRMQEDPAFRRKVLRDPHLCRLLGVPVATKAPWEHKWCYVFAGAFGLYGLAVSGPVCGLIVAFYAYVFVFLWVTLLTGMFR